MTDVLPAGISPAMFTQAVAELQEIVGRRRVFADEAHLPAYYQGTGLDDLVSRLHKAITA